jgi:NADH:ubiquinone oxidoreductase subunit K
MTPQLSWYLALSAVLFTIGVVGRHHQAQRHLDVYVH